MLRLLCVVLTMLQLHSALAAEPLATPNSIHAQYVVIKSGLRIGVIDETYTRAQDRYTLQSVAKPTGILSIFRSGRIFINSSGMVNVAGLQPLLFSYQMEGEAQKNNHAKFDWDKTQLTLNHDGVQTQLTLLNGTQDRLSAMYQFMFVNLSKRPEINFAMTNGRKLDDYHYLISTGEKYFASNAAFDTWYLDSGAKSGETRTQLWLAKSRYNLPCKLIITDPDGGKLTQELRKLEVLP